MISCVMFRFQISRIPDSQISRVPDAGILDLFIYLSGVFDLFFVALQQYMLREQYDQNKTVCCTVSERSWSTNEATVDNGLCETILRML